ncbi:hypothetical protein BDP27DRAFT_1369604 [Rhodocollybia butyracea]|uniref:Uncharacterized protein n=1 Tax=Rhodocollybia butyracea TaxID=206335 RepID=A0A9P5U1E3_9AGAR|nr:hypothetical protein BDP27DRAFT_1369604 [Rhodocollybia butyracea]
MGTLSYNVKEVIIVNWNDNGQLVDCKRDNNSQLNYSVHRYVANVLQFPNLNMKKAITQCDGQDHRIRTLGKVLGSIPAWGAAAAVHMAITPELYGHAVWPEHIYGDRPDFNHRSGLLAQMLPSYTGALQVDEKESFGDTAVLSWLARYPEDITPGRKEQINQTQPAHTLVYPDDWPQTELEWLSDADLRYTPE